jgi:superfamily II DNA or RNA helicase
MKKIQVIDEVHCKANAEARKRIKYVFSYKVEFWRQGVFAKQQEEKRQFLITGRKGTGGQFLTGLLPRVMRYCKRRGIDIDLTDNRETISPLTPPKLDGITFREDQTKAIRRMTTTPRGKIIAPTGSGKTLVALGFISKFPLHRSIIVAHTRDLIDQFTDEAKRFRKNLPKLYTSNGSKELVDHFAKLRNMKKPGLVITTIQSIDYIDPQNYVDLFDITIIDEVHHVNALKSQYGKFMQHNLSPRRYGFTATDLKKRGFLLVNEGLVGPRIARLRTSEAIKLGIIAKPKIEVANVPYSVKINKACTSYAAYYQKAIVENKARNQIIVDRISKCIRLKRPILVLVEKIKHGEILQDILKRRNNLKVPFIQGKMNSNQRKELKAALIEEKIHAAIATRVWMEGINIPNLQVIVYAAGMKEEKKALQAMGRGLRATDDKQEILLLDFLDPYRYLAEHSVMRLQVYNKEGWL